MTYKLYLDDERLPYIGWIVVRSFDAFRQQIETHGLPERISFDHDLAEEHYADHQHPIPYETYAVGTGRDCAVWLAEYCRSTGQPIPPFDVHSFNEAGAENIRKALS